MDQFKKLSDDFLKLIDEHKKLLIGIGVVFILIIIVNYSMKSTFVPLSGGKSDQIMLKNNKSTFVPLSGQKSDRTILKGVDRPENRGIEHHQGYHRAYVPGIYPGYIPATDLTSIIPNGLQQCIDGDSLRPCWTMRNGVVIINK